MNLKCMVLLSSSFLNNEPAARFFISCFVDITLYTSLQQFPQIRLIFKGTRKFQCKKKLTFLICNNCLDRKEIIIAHIYWYLYHCKSKLIINSIFFYVLQNLFSCHFLRLLPSLSTNRAHADVLLLFSC